MTKKLSIVRLKAGSQNIIGELAVFKADGHASIKDPLAIGVQPLPTGNTVVLIELIGKPKLLIVDWSEIALHYEITDPGLESDYIRATSGLQMATVVPMDFKRN